MYENPTKGFTAKDVEAGMTPRTMVPLPNGACIHVPARHVHRTIKVRGSLRIMDMCEGCYGVMDRAGCIAEVIT